MSLKENYKNEILEAGQSRTYNMVGSNGEVLYSNVKLEKAYTPKQEGDNFGANDINQITKAINGIIDLIYPVGTIYETKSATFNPNNVWGGTWVKTAQGRVPVGQNTNQTEFATVGQTGGERQHQLSFDEMPRHYHTPSNGGRVQQMNILNGSDYVFPVLNNAGNFNAGYVTSDAGSGTAHNNLQPYEVHIFWERTK